MMMRKESFIDIFSILSKNVVRTIYSFVFRMIVSQKKEKCIF